MSESTPTVSIAIRAFRTRWLGEAISSVLGQTFEDLELVVYDDAGDLRPVVDEFTDPRLRYVRADRQLGASGRFSAAVGLCRGRYIGVLDDDDRYEPEFVARLVEVLERDPGAGIAFCRSLWDVDGSLHVPSNGLTAGRQPESARALVAREWQVQPSRMLIRRSALHDADRVQAMPDGVSPDHFVNVRVAVAGWHHVLVDEALVVCRWHADQLSRSGRRGYDRAVATQSNLRLVDPELDSLRRTRHAARLIERAMFSLREGDRTRARADLREAASVDPAVAPRQRRMARLVAALPGAGFTVPWATRLKRRFHRRDALPPGATPVASDGPRPERQVASGAASLAIGSGAAQALTVLVAPVLTRLFDPDAIGAAGVLTGAMALVSLLACLRFDLAIPLARGRRATADLCVLCAIAAVLVGGALTVASLLFGQALCDAANVPEMGAYVWLIPLNALLVAGGLVGVGLLIRERRYGGLAWVRMAQSVGQAGTQVGAGLAIAGAGAAWFAGGVAAGSAAYSAGAITIARRRYRRARSGADRALHAAAGRARSMGQAFRGAARAARKWRRFAAWSAVGATLHGGSLAVPPILVAALYGPAEAGLFILVQRVLGVPVTLAMESVNPAWYGTAAEIVREDRGGLREPLARITRTMLLWGGAVLALVMALGPPLFEPIFGDEWGGAGALVIALAPLHFSIFAAAPASVALQARGRTDLVTALSAGRLIAPVAAIPAGHALGFALAGSMGLYAAAMTAVSVAAAGLAWRLSE